MLRSLATLISALVLVPGLARGGTTAQALQLQAGERLYQEGLDVHGQPVRATVEHDVALTGAQVSCASCHGRSGMGTPEGKIWVAPIASPVLARPRTLSSRLRPAYTPETLARAIHDGIDAGGNRLDPLMPRYQLSATDTAAIIAYLSQLSARPSEGVEGETLHFATVIAPGTPEPARATMLRILETYFQAKTAGAADRRARHSKAWPDPFGAWILHVWELHGPERTWRKQLDAHYRERPVFALVSGLGQDAWQPVHRFCEEHRLPCLLPNVDSPPVAEPDRYSLYFSGGVELEARVLASRLAKEREPATVLQVFRPGTTGARAAEVLARALGSNPATRVVSWEWSGGSVADLEQRARTEHATALALWLPAQELAALGATAPRGAPRWTAESLYLSATLGAERVAKTLGEGQRGAVLTPFLPAADAEPRFQRISTWLHSQGLLSSPPDQRLEDQTYFALTVLSEGFMHMKKTFLREYLLEGLEHFSGFENFSSYYPRLSFGPGQRLLSKGCFLVPLGEAKGKPEWVVP